MCFTHTTLKRFGLVEIAIDLLWSLEYILFSAGLSQSRPNRKDVVRGELTARPLRFPWVGVRVCLAPVERKKL